MKHISYYLITLLCVFAMVTNTGCKDDEEVIVAKQLEIDGSLLNKELDFRSATITIPINTNMRISEWSVNSDSKWVTAFQQTDNIILSVLDSEEQTKRTANITIRSELINVKYTIKLTQYGINDVPVRADTKIEITGGWDNQHHSGNDISKTWDKNFSTVYHSPWETETPTTKFPVLLDYYFSDNAKKIDRIVYYSGGGNGAMGEFQLGYSLEVKESYEEADFIFTGEKYDFGKSGTQHTLDTDKIPAGTKAIRFKVLSGAGDNKDPELPEGVTAGFVSCQEMEFYEKANYRDMNDQLLSVFTDHSCTAVLEDVTDEQIEALPGETFKRIAYALRDNTYDEWEKDFRIRDYEAYSNNKYWAEQIQTKKYSDLDNPTGIYVKKDEEMIVLVGKIPAGQKVSLQCIWEHWGDNKHTYKQTSSSGDTYPLTEGVNLLTMKGPGQLFIMYNVDGEGLLSNPEPVKIHIPLGNGVVNGFFDLKEHKTDAKYAELISKATHKYFCVRGERIMFYFHRLKMLDAAPTEILSAIHLWDDFIRWEQEMSGIEAFRQAGKYNNHMFAISPEGSYMWASDYQIGFVYTYLSNILLRENVMAVEDNAWGPAHEIGHVHQYAINWPGSTESSNNLFSNYIIRRLGKYYSRGRGLSYLANTVYKDDKAWYNMGSSTHQNEDTEIHMRMNWQLWIYYELCKGTEETPTFWPEVFNIMRTKYRSIPESDPGARQMAFVKAVCEAAQEDLTEFFETWGFFKTVNATIEQYGTFKYTVTDQMIEDTKAEIAKYPKKAVPIQYIEDRRTSDFSSGDYRYKEVGDVGYYTQFKENTQITKTPTYTLSSSVQGKKIIVSNGEQAVAFEVRKQDKQAEGNEALMGKVVFFANSFEFLVPRNISMSGCGIYAVQADGERKLMTQVKE